MASITLTKPISIFPAVKMDGSPTRRLVISVAPNELSDIPEELFAVKISQSKKADRAGKLIFKYFSYKPNETASWTDFASASFNIATPLKEIKDAVISAIGSQAGAKVQFTINMPGKFANIETSDGRYSLYDFNESPDGNLGYYLKGGTIVKVTLTPSEHQGNAYLRVALDARDKAPDELFVRGGKGKIFGQEDVESAPVFSGDLDDASDASLVW